jgi:hypothetical protein
VSMTKDQHTQRQIMQAHIEDCKASGQKVEQYCQMHNIKSANYYYWHRRLQENPESNFTKIKLPAIQKGTSTSSILFTSGHQLFFDTLPPVEYVKQLIA